jgi:hypothetical protein
MKQGYGLSMADELSTIETRRYRGLPRMRPAVHAEAQEDRPTHRSRHPTPPWPHFVPTLKANRHMRLSIRMPATCAKFRTSRSWPSAC